MATSKQITQVLPLSPAARTEMNKLAYAGGDGWWRVEATSIPSFVPATMKPKLDGGVVVISGSAPGVRYAMFAADRVDAPVSKIDIQPFAVAFFPDGTESGLIIVHHGGTISRSVELPQDYQKVVSSSGANSYFYSRPPEGKTSGSLSELGEGYKAAFDDLVTYLKSP